MAISRAHLNVAGAAALVASIVLVGIPSAAAAATPTGSNTTSESTVTFGSEVASESTRTTIVIGTVYPGVEIGCKILATPDGIQYQLRGGDPTVLRPGARVLVTGQLLVGAFGLCQQGTPLRVLSAVPLGRAY